MSKRNRILGWWATLAAAVVLCTALPAAAQERGQGRGQRRGFQLGNLQLLRAEDVQEELKLSDEQKQKVEQIVQQTGEKMREARRGGQEGGFREITQEADKQFAGVLKEDQSKRLEEIRLQVNGPALLRSDRELAQKLDLSQEQRQELGEVLETQGPKFREAFGQGRERGEELRKETNEQLLAVLTDEQKQQWNEMTGKPFEFDRSQLRFGFGGRGPGGGRPRGNN